MNGNEQIGFGLGGYGGALFKRDERVVIARVDDFGAGQTLADQRAEAKGDIEAKIFFEQAGGADRAGVMPAVAGIDHDSADFEAEDASEGGLAIAHRLRNRRRAH